MLQKFKLSHDWLQFPVNKELDHSTFHTSLSLAQAVKVVNDAVKRGITLNADYALTLSDDE